MPICYKAAAIGQSLIDGQEVHKVKLSSQIWHGMWLKLATKYKTAGPKEMLKLKRQVRKFVKKVMKQYVKKYGKIKKCMSKKEKRADKESMEAFVCFFFVQNLKQMKT